MTVKQLIANLETLRDDVKATQELCEKEKEKLEASKVELADESKYAEKYPLNTNEQHIDYEMQRNAYSTRCNVILGNSVDSNNLNFFQNNLDQDSDLYKEVEKMFECLSKAQMELSTMEVSSSYDLIKLLSDKYMLSRKSEYIEGYIKLTQEIEEFCNVKIEGCKDEESVNKILEELKSKDYLTRLNHLQEMNNNDNLFGVDYLSDNEKVKNIFTSVNEFIESKSIDEKEKQETIDKIKKIIDSINSAYGSTSNNFSDGDMFKTIVGNINGNVIPKEISDKNIVIEKTIEDTINEKIVKKNLITSFKAASANLLPKAKAMLILLKDKCKKHPWRTAFVGLVGAVAITAAIPSVREFVGDMFENEETKEEIKREEPQGASDIQNTEPSEDSQEPEEEIKGEEPQGASDTQNTESSEDSQERKEEIKGEEPQGASDTQNTESSEDSQETKEQTQENSQQGIETTGNEAISETTQPDYGYNEYGQKILDEKIDSITGGEEIGHEERIIDDNVVLPEGYKLDENGNLIQSLNDNLNDWLIAADDTAQSTMHM